MLWISDVPVTGVFFVLLDEVGVVGPVGVISGIVCESIPVVFYEFYWFRSCFVVEVVSGSVGRGDPKDFVFYVCWEVVRSSSVDPSSLVWVVVEACTNVRRLDDKAWSYVTSGLDVSLNQRVKYRVRVRVLTEGVPQVRLYTQCR